MPGGSRPAEAARLAALVVANLLGAAAFLYPMILPIGRREGEAAAHAQDAPVIFALLMPLMLVVILAEMTMRRSDSRTVAALGTLAAVAAALRIPTLPAGGTAFFLPVMIGGYVFGASFGFLLGAIALFVSAIVTGGVGPWMPFQMFTTAWVGAGFGLLGLGRRRFGRHPRLEVAVLAAVGLAGGIAYGAVMNLWFWPYAISGSSISWEPGLSLTHTLVRYWRFYLLTSLGYDLMRGLTNALLLAMFAGPLVFALGRFRARRWQAPASARGQAARPPTATGEALHAG